VGSSTKTYGEGGMNKITQYIPTTFLSSDRREVYEFEGLEGLLETPIVKRFSDSGSIVHSDNLAMWVSDDGHEWWVLGNLEKPVDGLPEWDRGWYRVMIDGAETSVSGKEVSVSAAGWVKLKNGKSYKKSRVKVYGDTPPWGTK
jgi:hypothetical protein